MRAIQSQQDEMDFGFNTKFLPGGFRLGPVRPNIHIAPVATFKSETQSKTNISTLSRFSRLSLGREGSFKSDNGKETHKEHDSDDIFEGWN